MVHKDNAAKFKKLADFNDPKVTFSVVAGGSEEPRIPILFPNAKLITTAGQVVLAAEPVRAKKADVWMSGDSDVILFAKRNRLGVRVRSRQSRSTSARTRGQCATAIPSGSTSSTSGRSS